VDVVLGRVDLAGLLDDLGRDLLVAADRLVGRRGGELAAIDRDHPHRDQPGVGAQAEHLAEELSQRGLVADPETRDRGVIRHLVRRDHTERDVLTAAPLDRARGALADRVGINQQRHHHLRVMRRGPPAVAAIGRIEGTQVELPDRVEHEPGKVILSQPLAQRRRQQQLLLAITGQEVLAHRSPHRSGTTKSSRSTRTKRPPPAEGLCDSLTRKR
jgi:hypothetical protein